MNENRPGAPLRRAVATLASVAVAAGSAAAVASNAELRVTVRGLAADEGRVRVAVFEAASGFPDTERAMDRAAAPARDGGATVTLEIPGGGDYAVAVHHDRDGDGTLDSNWLGMPQEDVAFSQGASVGLGPPSFDQAAFWIGAQGGSIVIDMGQGSGEDES